MFMLNYATRFPPGAPVELLENNLVRKKFTTSSPDYMNVLVKLFNYLSLNPDPKVVPFYNFQFSTTRNEYPYPYDRYIYSYQYDMLRCGLLPKEERDFIEWVGNRHEADGIDCLHHHEVNTKKHSFPKLFKFLEEVITENRYWDIHSGNIMFNEDWDYVLIDLEGFVSEHYPSKNLWLL